MEDSFTRLVTREARSNSDFFFLFHFSGNFCKSSRSEQSGLKLNAAFSDMGSQQHGTLNWTSDEKWTNFHQLCWCESFIFFVLLCTENKV